MESILKNTIMGLIVLSVTSCSIVASAQYNEYRQPEYQEYQQVESHQNQDFYQDPEYQTYTGTVEDVEDSRHQEYLDNRGKMGEAVRGMGFSHYDQNEIVDHVIQDDGLMTSDSLRESAISDEAWEQHRDDARFY